MNAEEIDAVVAQVRAGHTEAYAEIVRAHQHEVWRVAAFALGSSQQTEDLVQQVFVIAYQRIDRFEKGRDFGAWLRGIARNLVRDEVRKRAREARRNKRYRVHLEVLAEDGAAAEARAASMRRALAECREALSDSAREALSLRYEAGHDFTAVAEAIGRTVAGARQLLQRTRRELRHCIEGKLA